jgi:hypothetical protein
MHVWRTRKFAIRISNRSVMLPVAGCILLLMLIMSNLHQSRLVKEALARARAAEQAAARAQAEVQQAQAQTERDPTKDAMVRRTSRPDPKDAGRVRRLYEEINSLSRIEERIQGDLHDLRARMAQEAHP